MDAYIRQKRASPGMVQASDLQMSRPMSGMRGNSRELHAYDGPMQFIGSPHNPDQILSNNSSSVHLSSSLNSSRNNSNNLRSLSTINQEGESRLRQERYPVLLCRPSNCRLNWGDLVARAGGRREQSRDGRWESTAAAKCQLGALAAATQRPAIL